MAQTLKPSISAWFKLAPEDLDRWFTDFSFFDERIGQGEDFITRIKNDAVVADSKVIYQTYQTAEVRDRYFVLGREYGSTSIPYA